MQSNESPPPAMTTVSVMQESHQHGDEHCSHEEEGEEKEELRLTDCVEFRPDDEVHTTG
jgi:hypothetical protein